MQIFTYSVTDLTDYESQSYKLLVEQRDQAVDFGARMARELLEALPDLTRKGMCVAVYDNEGTPVYIAPLDPVQ